MGKIYDSLDEKIQEHLQYILKSSGMQEGEKSLEILAASWKEKESSFTKQITRMDMEEADMISSDDECGFMALTYSGSLVGSGPVIEGGRTVLYVSVGMRKDVPEKAEKTGSILSSDIKIGESIEFSKGPIKQSSPVYRIARVSNKIAIEDQTEKISEATLIIAEEFIDVNKTIII